eukprot:53139_1
MSKKEKEEKEEEKLIDIIISKDGFRNVQLFVDLSEYICSKKGINGKGLIINKFMNNKYGLAMKNIGIDIGWKLIKIDKQDTNKMSYFIIKNQLKNKCQMNKNKGYNVTFQYTEPTSPKSIHVQSQLKYELKCELVKEDIGLKVVRLFSSYDKYFNGIKGENGKSLIIDTIKDENFKNLNISKGWKLSKLGKRNVLKTSFIMLKNQLTAQASTAKKFGYELTFIDTNTKQNSISQPNSPNITKTKTKTK